MPKSNKKPCRLLRFMVMMILAVSAFLNVTHGLQGFRDRKNEFIGIKEQPDTQPPITQPPVTIQPTTTNPTSGPATTTEPPTAEPTTQPATESTTQPTIEPTEPPAIESTAEPTTENQITVEENAPETETQPTINEAPAEPAIEEELEEYLEEQADNRVPLGNGQWAEWDEEAGVWLVSDQDGNLIYTLKSLDDFIAEETETAEHIKDSPQTGDEETDPRPWLILMTAAAFVIRYTFFSEKQTQKQIFYRKRNLE